MAGSLRIGCLELEREDVIILMNQNQDKRVLNKRRG